MLKFVIIKFLYILTVLNTTIISSK